MLGQELVEKPLDGGDVDTEGLAAVVVSAWSLLSCSCWPFAVDHLQPLWAVASRLPACLPGAPWQVGEPYPSLAAAAQQLLKEGIGSAEQLVADLARIR